MEQALPQSRPECAGPLAGARARRPAAFALVLETFDVGTNDRMGLAGDRVSARAQWGEAARFSNAPGIGTGDPVPFRVPQKRRGDFCGTLTRAIHRSTHSTNAGALRVGRS
jgi:hypothetical protein